MELGEKLKQIRIARNLTQTEIAEKMNVSRNYVSRWESNERNMNTDQLIQFAKIVGVTLDYFNDNPPERTMFQLMAQLDSVFNDAEISESDKDKAYQDIMQIYLDSKRKTNNTSPASGEKTLLDIREE